NQQMGVDHTAIPRGYPEDFVAVLPENQLKENTMKCVRADKVDVLLARKDDRIFAIANTCTHLGGPLSDGELLDDCSVRCPWHNSLFSLKDGSVIEGPATQPQPKFDVRVKDGQIEVRLKQPSIRIPATTEQ
ncbi:MAG: Rieske (2Fe-2S) protein, partial [Bacteroidota bacterium]|nr:Rieske (2Fe-2S) protein [Bacteroidota bacterium]